ncbi:MAG TPA: PilZ domain-containing protein [Rudaea sp.]|nr:PilZ domain-containing protein [Rudaea sp.]
MSYAEKRRHPRLAIYSAALAVSDGEGYLSDVKDLSQGGACIGRPKNWPEKAPETCRVFFIFDQETVIGLDARVVRSAAEDLGLEFMPGQEARIESLLYESRFIDREAL